jgi:DNA-binding XRE family transcriptional regulator
MDEASTLLGQRASEVARAFGLLTRSRRKALNMTQDQLALATGVGRRFLIDLEAGKTTCQLGLSLVVAQALGLRPTDMLQAEEMPPSHALELPSPLDEELEHEAAVDG